jgi:hypothetical protein
MPCNRAATVRALTECPCCWSSWARWYVDLLPQAEEERAGSEAAARKERMKERPGPGARVNPGRVGCSAWKRRQSNPRRAVRNLSQNPSPPELVS